MPKYDPSRLDKDAVESMEALQSIVELGRNAREKRNIGLRTPLKSVVAILRNPGEHVTERITGSLQKYILSELNTWEFRVVPKQEEHDWVTLSLKPNFMVLGKKLGKKMKDVQKAVTAMTHDVSNTVMKPDRSFVLNYSDRDVTFPGCCGLLGERIIGGRRSRS
jgi:isoleucyl-tRNA synthetase